MDADRSGLVKGIEMDGLGMFLGLRKFLLLKHLRSKMEAGVPDGRLRTAYRQLCAKGQLAAHARRYTLEKKLAKAAR